MYRADPSGLPVNGHYEFQASPSSVVFPSESRVFYTEEYRPRSQSADTRRGGFPTRIFSEEHHDDAYPANSTHIRYPYHGSTSIEDSTSSCHRSTTSFEFPSTYRERREGHHASASPQFNSPAHNFTQHLRERSPSSSSALLNLLSRYPSARNSVYSSGGPRLSGVDHNTADTYQSSDASGHPLVELSVPKQSSSLQLKNPSAAAYRTYSLPTNDTFHHSSENSLISSFHSEHGSSPGLSASYEPSSFEPLKQCSERGYRNHQEESSWQEFDNRSAHKFYTNRPNNNHLPAARNKQWEDILDVTQLDSLLASVLEDNMNRSTSEWRNSFAQMQDRFKKCPPESNDSGILHGFTSSGAPTFLRRGPSLTKSASHNEMSSMNSLLGSAVERRAAETPEMRRSGAIDNFWNQTVKNRPSSPTVNRIPMSLTAAERLQMLHEPTDGRISASSSISQSIGHGNSVAARREHYLNEASSTSHPHLREPSKRVGTSVIFPSSPNFSDLDDAVQELQNGVRSTRNSNSRRLIGGCGRFPTDDHALSPPRILTTSRKIDSPSPTDSNSEASSVYQIPSGLPHPRPKHNIKEQLHNAGVTHNYFPRSGLKTSPNFPVPSTGSVASRITEFERRPSTPTLLIASETRQERTSASSGPMSPKSTVYKSKPVIHVDLGARSPRANSVFEFPQYKNAAFNISSELNETPVTKLSKQLAEFYVTSPTNNSISPRTNGHKIEEIDHHDTRKQPDFDTSSGTSDGSLNATHGAKGFEESLLIDDKNIAFPNDEVYTLATPKRTTVLPKKQPSINYPRFHFPQGKPVSQVENDAALRRVCEVFKELPNQQCSMADMPRICQAANLPLYWKMPILNSLTKGESQRAIQTDFTAWWRAMTSVAHDEASRFIYILSYGTRSYLKREDFYGIVMDVMHSHPGLVFCQNATEFHDKYCDVVIARIFWNLGRTWSGKVTAECLRKSDLLDQIRQLQNEDDINRSLRYFSYEHFYVVYCKFWEVDVDHDLKVSKSDMTLHKDGAITDLVLDRIFSPAVRQRDIHVPKKAQCMNLAEFTNFLLADEDKTHPSSLEYWFRVLDVDGDGLITMYDMEVFHGAILDKLHEEGIDSMSFKDVACQMFDMICPENGSSFRLGDLKKSPLSVRFINSLVNWRKFYTQEVTEGSERVLDETGRELTDWERFCSEEYETMMDNEDDVDENISVNLDDEDLKTNLSY